MTNHLVGDSASLVHAAAKVTAEKEFGDNLPPGYYFLPSALQLIEEYLVQTILDLPMASNIVKIMDFVALVDPDQLNFDEFKYCKEKEGYYITKKAERKAGEETIIETPTGHWREYKSNIPVFNNAQIVGYKNSFTFFQADGTETAWKLIEYTSIPEIVPVDALTDAVRAKIEEYVACRIRFKQVKLPEQVTHDDEIEKGEDVEEQRQDLFVRII